jgi:hypothetical protein
VFCDEAHNIVGVHLYGGNKVTPAWREETLPATICTAVVTFNGKPPYFWSDGRASTDIFKAVYWGDKQKSCLNEKGIPNGTVSISFDPPRPKVGGSYKIKPCKEETLVFENFNFKLAILQVLMYDLELIKPYFDMYAFAEQYSGKEIDTESETPIRPVVNYFQKLPIPKSLAKKVEEIYMDGGNDIYMNIAPQWDGENSLFDIDEITEKELAQFPHLQKVTLMSSAFDAVSKIFQGAGIEVESL